tara:strand:- start:116 stop:490 length:375 start_codon:yes stop_codon:yes gene_type:complete
MKITKRQLRRIIKEAADDPRDHAKTNMVDALDVGARQVLGKYIMAAGVGEMVGKNAGHVLDMPQASAILDLDPEGRVKLFHDVKRDLHENSVMWQALRTMLGPREYQVLIKLVSTQFEAELRGR